MIDELQKAVSKKEKEANENKSLALQSNAKLKKAEASVAQMRETMDELEQESGEQLTALSKKAKQATDDWQKAQMRAKEAEKKQQEAQQELAKLEQKTSEQAQEFER